MEPCAFCGEDVDPDVPGTFRQVKGWVLNRSRGGANGITLQEGPFAHAHGGCIDRQRMATKKRGWAPHAAEEQQLF